MFAILKHQTVADIISISGPLPVKLPKEKSKEEAVVSLGPDLNATLTEPNANVTVKFFIKLNFTSANNFGGIIFVKVNEVSFFHRFIILFYKHKCFITNHFSNEGLNGG